MIVVGLHAPQGAGKSTAYEMMNKALGRGVSSKFGVKNWNFELINIKSTFTNYVLPLFKDLGIDPYSGKDEDLAKLKQMQLAFSTAGENHIDKNIWSDVWYKKVMQSKVGHTGAVFCDDIRTQMNLEAMQQMGDAFVLLNEQEETENQVLEENDASRPYLHNQVHLIVLQCPREIRKQRVPESQWRDESNYTEQGLDLDNITIGKSFVIHFVDTSKGKEDTLKAIIDISESIINPV